MNGAAVGGEIRGISISISKQPKQIVRELRWHFVHVNPNRHIQRVVRITKHRLLFLGELSLVESPDVILEHRTNSIVGSAVVVGSFVSEELFEGSDERGFGSDGRVRVRMGGGAGGIREEEEERESEERDGEEDEEDW